LIITEKRVRMTEKYLGEKSKRNRWGCGSMGVIRIKEREKIGKERRRDTKI
jgi:hypothetical protein